MTGRESVAEPLRHWTVALVGTRTIALLVLFVVAGAALEMMNQFVTALATQVQVGTGQQMVYELRYRLFAHLESLGLHHHITTNTGDAVYRVDVDSWSVDNLAIGGVLPLLTSTVTLLVMFVVLLRLDLTVALLC
jgi:ATP-binding cassette subfamily B protein